MAYSGLAELYDKTGNTKKALEMATRYYILSKNKVYVPKALLLTIRLKVEAKELDEAKKTYQELKKRYPESLEVFKANKENQKFLEGLDQ